MVRSLSICVSLFAACFLFVSTSVAVMPPSYYAQAEKESKIKAIADVKSVKTGERYPEKGTVEKIVNFRLVKVLTEETVPEEFSGYCYSIVNQRKAPIGGTIYYYPVKGSRVYVAVSENGGYITNYRTVNEAEEKKMVDEYEKGVPLMGQVLVKNMPDMLLLEVDDTYEYFIDGKSSGTLKIEHHPKGYRTFFYELDVAEGGDKGLKIETGYADGRSFALTRHMVFDKDKEKYIIDAGFWDSDPDNSIPEGVLEAEKGERIITALPENTVTDLMLFEIVKLLPFDKETELKVNVLEAAEMNLKKGYLITYEGIDDIYNLHVFEEKDKSGNVTALYRLDNDHVLRRVEWDDDKEFVLVGKSGKSVKQPGS